MKTIDTGSDLEVMRERYRRGREQCRTLYEKCRDDIRFIAEPGHQWDSTLARQRTNRPMYEFPKLQPHCQMLINEQKQMRLQGKVRGVGPGDQGLAEIMQGLCRNIESVSNAEEAYDCAFTSAVQGGFGAWRVCADYATDRGFEQELRIEPIANALAVTFDPAAVRRDRRDAGWAFVEQLMPLSEFEARFADADVVNFESDFDTRDWFDAGKIRVAEYWYKDPCKRELLALSDGSTVYADTLGNDVEATLATSGLRIVQSRIVESHRVMVVLTNGRQWLGEHSEFKSRYIPIVPVFGNIQNIDGCDVWYGMVRPNKDLQRLHNVHKTAVIEAVAKAPKAPFIVRPQTIEGYENFWNQANAEDYPYLPISDSTPPGGEPKRVAQAEVPAALLQLAAGDNEDIKASTGQYNPSLGLSSSEVSGVAINARKLQSATATYNYVDGLTSAIRYTYEILVDAIPNYYDTPRVVRILGEDDAATWTQLYKPVVDPQTGEMHVINDIRRGDYDVVTTVGAQYQTKRMEAVAAFTQIAAQIGGTDPALGLLLAYQVAKNLDVPGSDEVSKALRTALIARGLLERGPDDAPAQPPPPNPMMQAQARKVMAQAMKFEADARKTGAETALLPQTTAAENRQANAQAMKFEADALTEVAGGVPQPGPFEDPSMYFSQTRK